MSDEKQEHFMLQRDFKETQRRENYRRAEAFLLWKFGSRSHDAMDRDVVHCVGTTMAALLVEFCEKVEEDLLTRMRDYDKVQWDAIEAKVKFGPFAPQTVQLTDAEVEALSKDWPGIRVEAGKYDFFKSSPMMNSPEPRKPMRRHWKDDPGSYTTEELKELQDKEAPVSQGITYGEVERKQPPADINKTPRFAHLSEVGEITAQDAEAMNSSPSNHTLKFDHWTIPKEKP